MSTPNPEPSGTPLRAIAMVLIAVAILFAGLGAASLGGSDSDESAPVTAAAAAPTTTVAPTTTTAPAAAPTTTAALPTAVSGTAASTTKAAPVTTSSSGASARADKSVPVRVFNNSTVSGLAADTADTLTSDGWNVSETGNYSYGLIQNTTVYYGNSASEKQAAEEIAAELGVKAEPRFSGIASASPGVIVIVTSE
ncbi:LytR C-terminal domain-containing protein [Prescottella subtropica]|uniref:LytR C-terminal domain-containing protein n=1 Tax=Prescottella subtropica TaxID=2545757 RepID=UPI0010FA42B3|nr:LytR C-terminal domain-containing protein [Prescottella subtropica]